MGRKRICWIGRFRGHGSFATAAREYVNALLPRMENLSIAPLEVLESDDPLIPHLAPLPLRGDEFKVVNHLPTTDPDAECYFSIFEYDHVPVEWAEILGKARVLLVQSNFAKRLFSAATGNADNIHVVPYIIPSAYTPDGARNRMFPDSTFVFGSVFEWVPRKVPELTIQAFEQEFDRDEDVRLILRADHPGGKNVVSLVKDISNDERIVVLPEAIPDLSAFYRGLDAYVSCTAGEGYGQTLAEAMACGIPTIAARNGGNLDFMDDENSYLVDVNDWSLAYSSDTDQFKWRLPVIDSIRATLRDVYTQWHEEPGKLKRVDPVSFKQQFSPEIIGKKLWTLLIQYC